MLPSAMPSLISASQTCAVELVGQQDHHEIAAARGLDDGQHLEALLARLRDRGGVGAQPDDDVDAGVLEVQRVGVALRAVADDGDGLAVEEVEVCVVVVDHARQAIRDAAAIRGPAGSRASRGSIRRRRARRACARGSRALPSAAVNGASARAQRAPGSPRSRPPGATARRRGSLRERSSVDVPELLEARVAAEQLDRLDALAVKPASSSSSRTTAGRSPSANGPGPRAGGLRRARAAPARAAPPTGWPRSRPTRRARGARRAAARGASPPAPRPGRPSACSRSGRARCRRSRAAGRSIRRSGP